MGRRHDEGSISQGGVTATVRVSVVSRPYPLGDQWFTFAEVDIGGERWKSEAPGKRSVYAVMALVRETALTAYQVGFRNGQRAGEL